MYQNDKNDAILAFEDVEFSAIDNIYQDQQWNTIKAHTFLNGFTKIHLLKLLFKF